jgi:hypothetical protein
MLFFGGLVRRLAGNTHTKIRSPLLAVEFRLVGEILTSGLPTAHSQMLRKHDARHSYGRCVPVIHLNVITPLFTCVVTSSSKSVDYDNGGGKERPDCSSEKCEGHGID